MIFNDDDDDDDDGDDSFRPLRLIINVGNM